MAREQLGGLIAAVVEADTDTGTASGGGAVGVIGAGSLGVARAGRYREVGACGGAGPRRGHPFPFPRWHFLGERGERPDHLLLAVQLDLLARLGASGRVLLTVAEATDRLREVLATQRVLLMVDDVWTATAAAAFRVTGPRGRLVYTSRDPAAMEAVGAVTCQVKVLSAEEARVMAAAVLDQPSTTLPSVADRVLQRVGWVALAVALLAAAVRGGARTLEQIDADLVAGEQVFGGHPYADVFKAMQIATATLPVELYKALLGLAVFPSDTRIPVAAIVRYWAHTRSRTLADTILEVEQLAAAGVLQYQDGHVGFHDLQYDYLLLHAPPPHELHATLVDAYRGLLSATPGSEEGSAWWRLPPKEPYITDHLVGHLLGAGAYDDLVATVTDPAFLARRIDTRGVDAAETDLAQAAAVRPADPVVGWWRAWIARHAHLLRPRDSGGEGDGGRATTGSVVPTFAAWLRADPAHREHGIDPGRLDLLVPQSCPQPRWGLRQAEALIRIIDRSRQVDTVDGRRTGPGWSAGAAITWCGCRMPRPDGCCRR